MGLHRSRYTFDCQEPDGKWLFYNTANGAFALADDTVHATLEHPDEADRIARELAGASFLTELSSDEELAMQREIFDAQRADQDELTLVLAPTYACNYRCPYCYEQGHNSIKGIMDEDVIDAVCEFSADRYEGHAFTKLSVQWYGGDPSLALDVVEDLSTRLIAWCDDHDVEYSAMMLTNCNLIDEAAVEMLVRCKVEDVLITIDGLEDTHNARRVAANGSNSFERNVNAARMFVEHGVQVMVNMNADKVNWPEYPKLRQMMRDELGIDVTFGRLCDYGHFFGTRDFKRPEFDLFDHEEFCKLRHDSFAQDPINAATMRAMLSPVPRFCGGQRDNYFVIDSVGDVYMCDGYIGEQEHVRFSVFDEPTEEQLHMVSHDPCESAQCSDCHLLPICRGNCDWERRATGMVCHPFLTTLPDYLHDYRGCFDESGEPFQLFAAPHA